MRVNVGCVFFWSHSSAGCRLWRLVLHSVEGLSIHSCPAYRHLCRVIYSSPGPSPCHWLMPPSPLHVSLIEFAWRLFLANWHTWTMSCTLLSVLFSPSLSLFLCSLLFFPKSPHLHFDQAKMWSMRWYAEITFMKHVLFNVPEMVKIWICELIT